MKKYLLLLFVTTITFGLTACNQDNPAPATAQATSGAAEPTAAAPTAPQGKETSGTVVETMDAAGYTYVQVDDGNEKIWAAAPQFAVNVGDEVVVPAGMAMHNYHSQTLDRDFSVVYFVESVLNASNPTMPTGAAMQASGNAQMPEGHPPITGMKTPAEVSFDDIEKAQNGLSIGEIYAQKADLADQSVTLRGKVVKFSPQIMGTNWIHLQDGSGDPNAGTHDLTVTSNVEVKVGDTLVASGPLTVDKDFGYGYQYDLIMEDAAVTVE